jgi:hypothetical protein
MKKNFDRFFLYALSLFLLTFNAESNADCMSYTNITLINAWAGADWNGPYAEFAIPHSALVSPAGMNGIGLISSGGTALCNTAPIYVSIPCTATIGAELAWLQQADQGFGVFADFHWDGFLGGFWSFSGADSICGPATYVPPSVSTGTRQDGDWCNINSDCQSGICMQPNPCHSEICQTAQCFGSSPYVSISTQGNFFLTAINGGGLSGTDAAINTDRTQQQQSTWEIFSCNFTIPNQLSIKTSGGQWVTAANDGGIGGPPADPWQIQTNRTQAQSWETFEILTNNANQCSFVTNSGNLVTAVNGGGYGNNDAANKFPIHTNSTAATPGQWESFQLNIGKFYPPSPPASWGGISGLCSGDGNGICCGRPDGHGACDGACVVANSCAGVTGYACPSNTQCTGTIDNRGNCSGQCVMSNPQ